MELVDIFLSVAILLCSLVSGLVYTFCVIVMPGIEKLSDHDYLNSFKVMDGVIQKNHPLFIVVWVGSVFAVILLCTFALISYEISEIWAIIIATVLYILAVQFPTVTINIPINNELQSLDLTSINPEQKSKIRKKFETTWVKWNKRRTVASIVATTLLIYQAVQY